MQRQAFSYIEAVISVVILSSAVISGLGVFGSYIKGINTTEEITRAQSLASELLAEIVSKPFEDTVASEGSFGLEAGETERIDFDDVDDYDTWIERPPQNLNGVIMDGSVGYTRSVRITNMDVATMSIVTTNGSSSVKKIEVSVYKNSKIRASLIAIRTRNGSTN